MTKQEALELIVKQPVADLITIDGENFPAERAMFTPKVDEDFTVFFGTFTGSNKCNHVKANPGVAVVWATGNGYLTVRGKAVVTDDQAEREHSWHPVFLNHFSGSADPKYAVLRITPVSVTYYQFGTMETQTIEV
jgi:general stress protein 26